MSHTWKELGMWASKDMTSLSVGSVDVTQQAGKLLKINIHFIYANVYPEQTNLN